MLWYAVSNVEYSYNRLRLSYEERRKVGSTELISGFRENLTDNKFKRSSLVRVEISLGSAFFALGYNKELYDDLVGERVDEFGMGENHLIQLLRIEICNKSKWLYHALNNLPDFDDNDSLGIIECIAPLEEFRELADEYLAQEHVVNILTSYSRIASLHVDEFSRKGEGQSFEIRINLGSLSSIAPIIDIIKLYTKLPLMEKSLIKIGNHEITTYKSSIYTYDWDQLNKFNLSGVLITSYISTDLNLNEVYIGYKWEECAVSEKWNIQILQEYLTGHLDTTFVTDSFHNNQYLKHRYDPTTSHHYVYYTCGTSTDLNEFFEALRTLIYVCPFSTNLCSNKSLRPKEEPHSYYDRLTRKMVPFKI